MSRKKNIILSSVLSFIAVFAAAFYYLAIYRAEFTLQQIVKSESNGKLILKVDKVQFNIFDLSFRFNKIDLQSADTSLAASGYHITTDRLSVKIQSVLPFLGGKQVIIDTFEINKPVIHIIKFKHVAHQKFSLPEEISKVYLSLEKVLKVLNLNYLHIARASISLIYRTKTV